jgi:hypothetical protein
LGHLRADFVDAKAVVGVGVGAVFSASIVGVELGSFLRGFGAQRGVGGCGQADAQLEQQQLARRIGREGEAAEAPRLVDQSRLARSCGRWPRRPG